MQYRVVVRSGRREIVYRVEADSVEQARERYATWLSFTGTLQVNPVEVEEDKANGQ